MQIHTTLLNTIHRYYQNELITKNNHTLATQIEFESLWCTRIVQTTQYQSDQSLVGQPEFTGFCWTSTSVILWLTAHDTDPTSITGISIVNVYVRDGHTLDFDRTMPQQLSKFDSMSCIVEIKE